MRVISIHSAKPGMQLGKNIFGPNGEILLRQETILTLGFIEKLRGLGYMRIYIEDAVSEGIDCAEFVDERLKNETVQEVKSLYNDIAAKPKSKLSWANLDAQINAILDQMLNENRLVFNMVDLKSFDNYTFSHCVNVAFLAIAMGIERRMPRETLFELAIGAMMHDIGKIFVPIEIVNKPGALSDEEFDCMKTHSQRGYEYLLESDKITAQARGGVLMHHERVDGRGYPDGIDGNEISEFGKLYAVCDVFDAITSDRPYRKAWDASEAIEYIMANGGIRFDTGMVESFLKRVVPYPVGTIIKLSNGCTAIVIEDNPEVVSRPRVRIFQENSAIVEPYEISLGSDRRYLNVTITETLAM